jgi:rod shape-determining protein MreC
LRERSGAVDRFAAPFRAITQRAAVPFFIFLSAMFIVLGKADVLLFDRLRILIVDGSAPILEAVSQPIATAASGVHNIGAMFDVYGENQRLRDENARLLEWQEVARGLAAENTRLRGLVKLAPEGARSDVSAQVIADSGGAFARNVLVSAGRRDGVARGQAAVTGEGLVGRVAEVGDRASRILLLTDLNSRIPVVLESSRERAVMAGDNSVQPRLLYLPATAVVKAGERIVTGGAGGVFPPGLPVGVVASVDGPNVRVEPYAELPRLDYVRIIDFGLEGLLPPNAVPVAKPARGPKVVGDPDTGR